MKRKIAVPIVLVLGIALMSISTADEHEDTAGIREALASISAAYEAGDANAVAQYIHPELSSFLPPPLGGLLDEEFDKNELQAWFDSGFKLQFKYYHLGFKVYGNTAIVTSYNELTVTIPTTEQYTVVRRNSLIWIKEEGKWKMVHRHASPLIIEPPDND